MNAGDSESEGSVDQELQVGDRRYRFRPLSALDVGGDVAGLPYSLRVLLENLVRHVDGVSVTDDDVAALASWDPAVPAPRELAFAPARILLQDFTCVPAVVDLAAMRCSPAPACTTSG